MFQSSVSIDSYADQPILAKVGIWFLASGFASFGSLVVPGLFAIIAGDAKIDPIAIPFFVLFVLFFQLLGWGSFHAVLCDVIKCTHPMRVTLIACVLVAVVTGLTTIVGKFAGECTIAFLAGAVILGACGHGLAATGNQSDKQDAF